MRRFLLGMVLLFIVAGGAYAQHFTYVNTGQPYAVIVQEATIGGTLLAVGDEIGLFSQEQGICVGGLEITAGNIGMFVPNGGGGVSVTAWQSTTTGGGLPGYDTGDTIVIRLWDASNSYETGDAALTLQSGDGTYGFGALTNFSLAAAAGPDPQEISLNTASIAFGNVVVGSPDTYDLIISNTGDMPLDVTSVSISGDAEFTINPAAFSGQIAGGATQTIQVTFNPSNPIAYSATVTINSDDADEGTLNVGVAGTGFLDQFFIPVLPTGITHTFTVNDATIGGVQLAIDDEIAVYDLSSSSGATPVGVTVVTAGGFPLAITAYGDDGNPGFTAGNTYSMRVYDDSDARAYDAIITLVGGDATFANGGATTVTVVEDASGLPQYSNMVQIAGSVVSDAYAQTFGDVNNLAVLDNTANDGYDITLDIPEPTATSHPSLAVYFPHPEFGSFFGNNFMYDVRESTDLTTVLKTYDFVATTSLDESNVGTVVPMVLDFTIGGGYDGSYGVVLGDATDGVYQNIRQNNDYDVALEAAGTLTRNLSLSLGDATAPVVAFNTNPTAGGVMDYAVNQNIDWTITDVSPIRRFTLNYSYDAGQTFSPLTAVDGDADNDYLGTDVSSTLNTNWDPTDVYSVYATLNIAAEDWAGNTGNANAGFWFNVVPTTLTETVTQGWRMVSLPMDPSDNSIAAMFGDDWTQQPFVFNYEPATGYALEDSMFFGGAYWLAAIDATADFDFDGTAHIDADGALPQDNATFLTSEGWEMIGTMIPDSVHYDSLMFTDGTDTYYRADAVAAGWVDNNIFSYNPVDGSYFLLGSDADTDPDSTVLLPWEGYWLYIQEPTITMLTHQMYPVSGQMPVNPEEGEVLPLVEDWRLPIRLQAADGLADNMIAIGGHIDATDEFDVLHDVMTPPAAPTDYIRGYFLHEDWVEGQTMYSSDIREAQNVGEAYDESWTLYIDTPTPQYVIVNFENIEENLPENYTIIARNNGNEYDLRDEAEFMIHSSNAIVELNIAYFNTVDENVDGLPEAFGIASAYPNPFNPEVNVKVAMPVAGDVKVRVYNVLGHEVANFDRHIQAGYSNILWNASNFTSGIYFMRVQAADGQNAVTKLMLMK